MVAHEKWKELPATEAALRSSATGNIGTPIAKAVCGVTGSPNAASLSRGVIHTFRLGFHIRPDPVRNVGKRPLVALQHKNFQGLSPR